MKSQKSVEKNGSQSLEFHLVRGVQTFILDRDSYCKLTKLIVAIIAWYV